MLSQPILVVDDEPEMRIALSHVLTRSGYLVEIASNGFEAMTKFKKDKYKAVITDIKMPKMSGMDVLGEIKKISPHVPVIVMSAYGTISKAVEAMKMGASDYILKPFTLETIESIVNRVCEKNNINKTDCLNAAYAKNEFTNKIITEDEKLLKIFESARNIAKSDATVLIQGESGTGKEVLATFIHQHSERKNGPYLAVNCAALPESLAENELFGHEKGAFTGAVTRSAGKFELANHGTIVLDEISEMSISLQPKILRVLQEKEICRVGGSKQIPVDSRVIAITNVDLNKSLSEGKFREDLFYRINVIPFTLPPLRERKGDIALLTEHFLVKHCIKNKKNKLDITKKALNILFEHYWKGNVRELENTIERAVLLCNGDVVVPEHLDLNDFNQNNKIRVPISAGMSVREMEKELIFQTLEDCNNNRSKAAKLLDISIRTLRNKLREYSDECR